MVMAIKQHASAYLVILFFLISISTSALGKVLCSLTKFDPYPYFSTMYPYDYVAYREKIEAFDKRLEIFEEDRFRLSLSVFRQSALCANNINGQQVNIADLPEGLGLNFGALFFDPLRAEQLARLLGIQASAFNPNSTIGAPLFANDCPPPTTTSCPDQPCFDLIRTPFQQANSPFEFGVISLPSVYKKQGVRFEAELLLIDSCADAVGLRLQFGVADVRHTVTAFNDLTCLAAPFACPAHMTTAASPACSTATSCCDQPCCFGFSCACKTLMIDKITSQRDAIGRFLNYDFCNTYHEIGVEDARIALFWRHIYDLNPDDVADWPRLLFMPFAEFGVAAPMSKQIKASKIFGVPFANNGHPSVGACGGFTLDFLDSVDIAVEGGVTYFFNQKYCNFPLPTNEFEFGIFPYRADYDLRPGLTWDFAATMNAYQFLGRLSFWIQYMFISHAHDKIELCRSLIPEQSAYSPEFNPAISPFLVQPSLETNRGFLIERAECLTKWEVQYFTMAFNYDIAPHINIGVLWQAPFSSSFLFGRRNAPRSSTVLASINMTY
jgi:hypothetical protein